MAAPAFPLTEVFNLINNDYIEFALSSSIKPVIAAYSDSKPYMSTFEAENLIIDALLQLRDENFVRTVIMKANGARADEYGMIYDNRGWYLKLNIETYPGSDERYVDNISFHPPRRNLTTTGGINIRGKDQK